LKLIPFTNQISLLPHLQTWERATKIQEQKKKKKKAITAE